MKQALSNNWWKAIWAGEGTEGELLRLMGRQGSYYLPALSRTQLESGDKT